MQALSLALIQGEEIDLEPDAPSDLDYLSQVRPDLLVRSNALAQTQGGRT